jgi:hypothetical protein
VVGAVECPASERVGGLRDVDVAVLAGSVTALRKLTLKLNFGVNSIVVIGCSGSHRAGHLWGQCTCRYTLQLAVACASDYCVAWPSMLFAGHATHKGRL